MCILQPIDLALISNCTGEDNVSNVNLNLVRYSHETKMYLYEITFYPIKRINFHNFIHLSVIHAY